MTEERGEYNVGNSDGVVKVTTAEIVNAEIYEAIWRPNTPRWTNHVLIQIANADSTYPLIHIREDVRLLIRILEDGKRETVFKWMIEDAIPDWMRHALALFQWAENRFERAHMVAEAEVVENMITIKCGFD